MTTLITGSRRNQPHPTEQRYVFPGAQQMSTAALPTTYYTGQCFQFYDNTANGQQWSNIAVRPGDWDRQMVTPKRRSLTKLRGRHLKEDRYSVCVFHFIHPDHLSSTSFIPNIQHKTIHSHTQQPSRHHTHNTHHTPKDSVTCKTNRLTTRLHRCLNLNPHMPGTPARKPCCVAI